MKQSKPKQNQLKLTMAAVTGLTMLLITLLLGMRFYLMLYFPGTQETAALFNAFSPYWPVLGYLSFTLKSPLSMVSQLLLTHLPGSVQLWFPAMPSATLMAQLGHQPVALCKLRYPGQVDWLCLMAIPFWNLLLLALHQGFWYLRENEDFDLVAHESIAILAKYKQTQPRKAASPGTNLTAPAPASKTDQQSHEPQKAQNDRTSERLLQSKNNPPSMPLIVKRPTLQDWEQYKQEEGDLMVRDMVRQLKQENSSLLAQQKQLRSTFSQYFSPQALQYLENNKGTFQKVDNEKHRISVLFCDIRGFSAYSQSASSDEVVQYLGEYFGIASHYILQKHNGIVSKLMGDGLMAYWGFPTPNTDHAYTATLAALGILHEVALRNQTKPHAAPLNIGIGIATGDAIIGNIGSDDFKDFTLIGPSVNLAARLEETNKSLDTSLIISSETYRALQGRIPCQDRGEIEIRGWQNREHVYAPILKQLG
jgi:class 3 adenylate cyclase